MDTAVIRVLLVDADVSSYRNIRELLATVDSTNYQVNWVTSFDDGLAHLMAGDIDMALVGERISGRGGTELIRAATGRSVDVPIILLSDNARQFGHDALESGAVDYLFVRDLTSELLARAIRYAIGQAASERQLHASQGRFRALYEHASDIIAVASPESRILHINPAIETLAGVPADDLIGTLATDRCHPDDLSLVVNALSSILGHPQATVTVRYRFLHANGSWRWFESTVTNLVDDPAVGGYFSTVRDVTEQVANDQRIHDQAQRLQLLAEMSAAFSEVALDFDSILETLGQRVSETLDDICVLRLLSDDGLSLVPAAIWHPDDAMRRLLREAQIGPLSIDEWLPGTVMRTGEPVMIPYFDSEAERRKYPEKDDSFLKYDVFSMLVVPMRVRGDIIGTLAVSRLTPDEPYTEVDRDFLQDLADRAAQTVDNARLFHRAIEAEDRFRTLVEHIPAATFTIGIDGQYHYMSPRIERLLGYPVERWNDGAAFWSSILHPDDVEAVVAEDRRTDETGDPFDLEYRYIAADGRVVWVRNQTELLRGPNGEARFWQGYMIDVTARKEAEQRLRAAEDQFRTLVEHSPAVIFTSDIDDASTPLYMSPQIEEMLGYPAELWSTADIWHQIIHPDDAPRVQALDIETGVTLEPFDIEFRVFAADGRIVWVRNYSVAVCDERGTSLYWQGYLIDTTAQKKAEEEILFQAQLLETVGQAVIAVDTDDRITYWNRAAEQLYGWSAEEVLGRNAIDIMSPEETRTQALDALRLSSLGPWEGELLLKRRDGSQFPAQVTNSIVLDDSGNAIGMIGVSVDISERKQLEQQLLHQAFHDALTSLPNRNLFLDRTRHALTLSGRLDQLVAVLFLDLDNFKIVNDSLGHDIGDQLLVVTAERIQSCLREGDTAARLGGDEFAILLENLDSVEETRSVARRLTEVVRRPLYLEGHEMFVTPSIGIAVGSANGDLAEDLLRDADVAMYTAKRNGRARFEVFEPEMGSLARQRLELEHDLRRALERDELELHYQPVINLCDGSLAGFEALLRWQHPTRGWIAPDVFVPVAEETGLIVPVGAWALREACRTLATWQINSPIAREISISVNLSGRQFKEPGLVEEVAMVLDETGVAPECLNLEITETIMMADEEGTSAILRQFEQLGVTLAIDDFGTGYSSLGTLRHFPVNTLKIDRSFVDGLGAESDDSVIVSGVVGLAHGLGLRVVAEGVETPDQLARLRELGCDYGQGFYFARPLAAAAAEALLASYDRSVAA